MDATKADDLAALRAARKAVNSVESLVDQMVVNLALRTAARTADWKVEQSGDQMADCWVVAMVAMRVVRLAGCLVVPRAERLVFRLVAHLAAWRAAQ